MNHRKLTSFCFSIHSRGCVPCSACSGASFGSSPTLVGTVYFNGNVSSNFVCSLSGDFQSFVLHVAVSSICLLTSRSVGLIVSCLRLAVDHGASSVPVQQHPLHRAGGAGQHHPCLLQTRHRPEQHVRALPLRLPRHSLKPFLKFTVPLLLRVIVCSVFFTYAAPILKQVYPPVLTSGGAAKITIKGSNFGRLAVTRHQFVCCAHRGSQPCSPCAQVAPTVLAGGLSCPVATWNDTCIT
jgi:hypothetical protein